ncbi:hypothetical protein BOX15_Mlig022902g1 [Macrostomum lignano]|uniref:Uncharacterized protein n=1 Tax=Macrostomum lignano TaxID=282301 RepID=A0A267F8K2_9PLAT|nr:hypothetical protein BOX15_Mlig022902g1 [Macrostomum lignano]
MFRALASLAASRGATTPLVSLSRPLAAAAAGPSDPIQKLFLDKLREYKKKQAGAKDGLVDASPQSQREYTDMLERVERQFEAKGQDMSAFPKFEFKEPTLQNPSANR